MAMKFWFGKKEIEPETLGGVSSECGLVAAPGADGGCQIVTAAPLFTMPRLPDGKPSPAKQPAQNAAEPEPMELSPPAEAVSNPVLPLKDAPKAGLEESGDATSLPIEQPPSRATGRSDTPVHTAASAGLKAVDGHGTGTLRLTLRVAGEATGAQAAAEQKAMPVLPVGRPLFGLRARDNPAAVPGALRANVATAESAPVAVPETEKGEGAKALDVQKECVRPKPDQRALYYQLMDGLYDAILILDDQGHVVDGSKRIAELLGYSREESWDMPIEKIITGMSRQMFEHLRRNLKENHHILIDARCYRKDGTSFAGEVGVSTLSLTSDANMVFAIRNVERRKNAMDELRRSQAAFEAALSPAFVCDVDGFFQAVNPALLESFGVPDAEQAKSVRFVDLLPDAARLFLQASCGEKVREKLNVSVANGVTVSLDLALVPLFAGQTVVGVAGSLLQT